MDLILNEIIIFCPGISEFVPEEIYIKEEPMSASPENEEPKEFASPDNDEVGWIPFIVYSFMIFKSLKIDALCSL